MAYLQERGLFGFIWPQSPSCPSPAPQLLPSSAGRALSKQVRGIALKLPSDTRGFSGLSSAAVNHLVLGGVQVCDLNSSDSLPWPMPDHMICKCVTLGHPL